MSASFLDDNELADLLVQREIVGLSAAEARELDALLEASPGSDRDALAAAAAALTLAAKLPAEPMPEALKERVISQGRAVVGKAAAEKVVPLVAKAAPVKAPGSSLGWYAAAACLLLAVAAWWPGMTDRETVAVVTATVPTPDQERQALLAGSTGAITESWSGTDDPASAGVAGDVVWDPATQSGYMRFVGLPANDASAEQYQLWIFDGTRDERYPVDGGVFDIPAGATEVVVPIHARLPVRQAALFAVTVERPGGVVVSSRERIVALAKVATS
jgi:hypothetical protein